MISSFPSHDEELLNSAYANINLIADKAWTFDKEDTFQKLNKSLWLQNSRLTAKYKENGAYRRKRVRDIIPDSRLASYGNYEYNEERESIYKSDDSSPPILLPNFCWTEVTEPWMLPEVEKHFAWLTSSGARSSREFLATRVPEPDDARKIGTGFKSHWENCFQGQHLQRLSPTGKSVRTSPESSKETNLIESDSTDKAENYAQHRRYTIENSLEMQLHIRLTSEAVRNLWKPSGSDQQQFAHQRIRLQCYQLQQPREQNCRSIKERQQQFYYALQYRPLILRTEYQAAGTETYGTRKHLPPVLSPEVPEFFPKVPVTRFNCNKEPSGSRVQYFPSLNERSYQNELFPYNRTHENFTAALYQNTGIPLLPVTDATTFIRPAQQWYQRIPTPTQIQISNSSATPVRTSIQPLRATGITHHPLQVQEKFLQANPVPIPVYQHPVELYHENGQKRKNQGVDFKNLILLTKNAIKVHRGQMKTGQQKSSYLPDGKNRGSKSESELLQWLDKSCSAKTREFTTATTLPVELKSLDGKSERKTSGSRREKDGSKNTERSRPEVQGTKTTNEKERNDNRSRRRLYRDVVTNTSVSQAILENVFEKRYDELEQQAMEQYRTSEESLALKYQELERQAMEQYKCCGGNVQEHESKSCTSIDDKRLDDRLTDIAKDTGCHDGQKCPGFGNCSPANSEDKEGRDFFRQSQDNILQDCENESITSGRLLSDQNSRMTVLSKSLTTLSRKVSYGSKNTAKGASGDKIDKTVSVGTSSKRRLILVSPFEKESEAKVTRSTDLEEFYCIAQTNRNIFGYYNNRKVGQIGGGDENITIVQSPRTEGTNHLERSRWNKNNRFLTILFASLAVGFLDDVSIGYRGTSSRT